MNILPTILHLLNALIRSDLCKRINITQQPNLSPVEVTPIVRYMPVAKLPHKASSPPVDTSHRQQPYHQS